METEQPTPERPAVLLLRIPRALHADIRAAARADGVSMAHWATMVLARQIGHELGPATQHKPA